MGVQTPPPPGKSQGFYRISVDPHFPWKKVGHPPPPPPALWKMLDPAGTSVRA